METKEKILVPIDIAFYLLVPKVGVEPTRPCGHSALNAARIANSATWAYCLDSIFSVSLYLRCKRGMVREWYIYASNFRDSAFA